MKIIKTAMGLISLSFSCGVETNNTVEVPQYVKIICTKYHEEGSLKKIGREYRPQLELLKGEIEHLVFDKKKFADSRRLWKPYCKLDVLFLAFLNARHSIAMQKLSGFGIKDRKIKERSPILHVQR